MKIRKAEFGEVRNYTKAHPLAVAPLFGFVIGVPTILMGKKTSYTVPVEHLAEGRGEPNYEAILPKGLHLSVEGIHTVIGFTQADLLERLSYGLEECTKDCDCVTEDTDDSMPRICGVQDEYSSGGQFEEEQSPE